MYMNQDMVPSISFGLKPMYRGGGGGKGGCAQVTLGELTVELQRDNNIA